MREIVELLIKHYNGFHYEYPNREKEFVRCLTLIFLRNYRKMLTGGKKMENE